MTTLYYIPEKDGKAYIAPPDVDVALMDVEIVDTAGLVSFVCEMMGLLYDVEAFNVRLCRYYKLVRKWMESHPDNVLGKSFQLAHLSTARQMLIWRDELKMAQWDFVYDDDRTRLGALASIEKMECVCGLPDRIISVTDKLKSAQTDLFARLRIVLNFDRNVLRPLLLKLLDALEKKGATIVKADYAQSDNHNLSVIRNLLLSGKDEKIPLDPKDKSFEVRSFDTAYDEAEYIAVCQHDFKATLFINRNSKETDNRLAAQGLPTSGSVITSRSRILNLMPLALSLYDEHLQITKFIEWLTAPVHPLPGRFRYQFAEAIARSGGFHNKECLNIVKKYVNGDYAYADEKDKELTEAELEKLEAKRRLQREESLSLFVPYLSPAYRTAQNAERTLRQLSVWARQRVHTLEADDNQEAISMQLNALADAIDILMLLFSERDETFDLSLANEWVRDIPAEITLPQHPARVGAVFTVSSPWDIVSPAPQIVWANMENEDVKDFDCEFLLPAERKAIEPMSTFWKREDESRYRYLNSIMPFLFARDRIVLTCANKRGGELIVPHPILTRLKIQIENFDAFISHKDISVKRNIVVERVDNSTNLSELKFRNADKIKMPVRMSATGLETFTMFPFDFLFERILNYQTAGLSSLPPIHTTRGNVAHATIAKLFSPEDGSKCSTASEIRTRVRDGYEAALQDAINECGAIFMLPENKLELSNLHYQLKNCIESLLDIIEANGLAVDGCENHYSKFVDLYDKAPAENTEDDLLGYIDMKLSDSRGHHIVFDLKWTRSRSFHRRLLEKNRSTQLAVYSELLSGGKDPVITAYFVMPRGRLFSCYQFKGKNVEQVNPENAADIMTQLINAFRYRKDQLISGILENGEHHPIENLSYGKDTIDRNLFPLIQEDDAGIKGENIFSNYRLFKGF